MRRDPLRHRKRVVPPWWSAAKLGIFVHWVPASVPGFAPTEMGITELLSSARPDPLSELPYSEWYENSLRFEGSSVHRFHRERYGDRPYERFVDDFVAGTDQWEAADWARQFAATGARYVVLVTKHHDGWCLWPSAVTNPNRPDWCSERDLVGELAAAVRAEGMRFGVYYSGGYDWTFNATPIGSLSDGLTAIPRGDYIDYATAQVRELIDRYRPSVLWNDIAWPSTQAALNELFEYYFEQVPDGVVNDRWMTSPDLSSVLRVPGVKRAFDSIGRASVRKQGLVPPTPKFFQFRTPEFTTRDTIDRTPWEATRGMDHGFGFNHTSTDAEFLTRSDLISSFVDIVSKGGNLLLNVGPRGEDAQIPVEQSARLEWLAEWMAANGGAIGGTIPWIVPRATSPEGFDVHFTADGNRIWALIDTTVSPTSPASVGATVTLPLLASERTEVTNARGDAVSFEATPTGLRVTLPPTSVGALQPIALAIDHVEAI